jgi:CheY-like chemotaxis protein
MNDIQTLPRRRVILVERDGRNGVVLERALASRGWSVTRVENARALLPHAAHDCDVALLALDDDEPDIFEVLIRLSSLQRRPSVVLLTRRAYARSFQTPVLESLGVDRVVAWPCRVDQIANSLESALSSHAPVRLVS